MTPGHDAASRLFERLEQFGTADLLVAFRFQFGDDEFSLIVPQKRPVRVSGQESVSKKCLMSPGSGVGFPLAITRPGVEAAQFAETANAVDLAILEHGRPQHSMQAVVHDFSARAAAVPHQFRALRPDL